MMEGGSDKEENKSDPSKKESDTRLNTKIQDEEDNDDDNERKLGSVKLSGNGSRKRSFIMKEEEEE